MTPRNEVRYITKKRRRGVPVSMNLVVALALWLTVVALLIWQFADLETDSPSVKWAVGLLSAAVVLFPVASLFGERVWGTWTRRLVKLSGFLAALAVTTVFLATSNTCGEWATAGARAAGIVLVYFALMAFSAELTAPSKQVTTRIPNSPLGWPSQLWQSSPNRL